MTPISRAECLGHADALYEAEMGRRADQLWLESQKRRMLSPGTAKNALTSAAETLGLVYLLACTILGVYMTLSWLVDALR